jgi:hypothetical protein
LRAAYAGQVGILHFAAAWAEQPFPILGCSQDLDGDNQPECVLASSNTLALFDAASGALTYLFGLQTGGAQEYARLHQLVATSAQFAIGLSDPQDWDPSRGLRADPQIIPGAFADPGCPCQAELRGETLVFWREGVERSYRLLPGFQPGISVTIRSATRMSWELPLAVDPEERFTPGWGRRYAGEWQQAAWVWGLKDGANAIVQASLPFQAASFLDSRSHMGLTEDPNAEYPPGHYLTFPLSLVQVQGEGSYWVEIRLAPQ